MRDHNSLVNAMRGIEVVISVMGGSEVTDQLKIVDVIKELDGAVKVGSLSGLLQFSKFI